jgi:hypothetical protein
MYHSRTVRSEDAAAGSHSILSKGGTPGRKRRFQDLTFFGVAAADRRPNHPASLTIFLIHVVLPDARGIAG